MKNKVSRLAEEIAGSLTSSIESIEAITLHESAESDIHDPYFFLSLDVYYKGALPPAADRQMFFENAGGFESSDYTEKDRFFLEQLPVRIEYKHTQRVDHIIDNPQENLQVFRANGTYMFYRIYYGTVLREQSNWLKDARKRLENLPDLFWNRLGEAFFSAGEHYLTDIKSAVVREDSLFYLISLSGFIRSVCSFLFSLNRQFEPSGRKLFEQTLALKIVPENFRGRFDSILREDSELPPSRKQEIAEKIVRSLMYMVKS